MYLFKAGGRGFLLVCIMHISDIFYFQFYTFDFIDSFNGSFMCRFMSSTISSLTEKMCPKILTNYEKIPYLQPRLTL